MASVVIIGAGPAGSVAAILLARGGVEVTLLEQHRFPRDKVCGECISALGIEVLERLGLAERVQRLGAVSLRKTSLHPSEGEGLTIDLPRTMWGLSRRVLDVALLEAATEAGATVIQPARCEGGLNAMGLAPLPRRVSFRELTTNAVREVKADWVMVADGKGAIGGRRSELTGDLGLKAHFVGVESLRDRIELFGVEGHYVGAAPIEPGASKETERLARWNIAFSVPAKRVQAHRQDLELLWLRLLAENAALRARFGAARKVGEWLASPLPRFGVAARWADGVIPIGNAAAALEPIGGEGMGLAMRSAEMAARALLDAIRRGGPADTDGLRRGYQKLWKTRRAACRGLALAMGSPAACAGVVELARGNDSLARGAMRLMGKG